MRIELHCQHCLCRFCVPAENPAEVPDHAAAQDSPWSALGDGQTFEDWLFADLTSRGPISCPECGEEVRVDAESLADLVSEMLACM